MGKEKLTEILKNLRNEVSKNEIKDENTKNRIEELINNLEVQIESNETVEPEDFTANITQLIEQFEIEHPNITALLSKLSMSLSNMGI
ncbi:MAG: DUF4404 family protein [Thermodesulfobacteriota bacterium]